MTRQHSKSFTGKSTWLLICGWLLLMEAPVCTAGNMGPLDDILAEIAPDDTWDYQNSANQFSMSNDGAPGAIQYFYLLPKPGSEPQRQVTVEVTIPDNSPRWIAGGLLYGYDPDTRNYFLMTIEPNGVAAIYRRDETGIHPILRSKNEAVRRGRNQLAIAETRGEVELRVNSVRIGALRMNGTGRGGVGIAAGGLGTVVFSAFNVTTEKQAPPAALADPRLQASGPASAQQSTLRIRPVQVIDDSGPVGRMVAYNALVPTDWRTKGGITWNPRSGCYVGPGLGWGAASPDESYAVALFPPISWSSSTFGDLGTGCLWQTCLTRKLRRAPTSTSWARTIRF